jgi:Domain of unknown function (DUF1905)
MDMATASTTLKLKPAKIQVMADRQRFNGTIRYFRPQQASGLAVIDIPADVAATLGGLKQMKVAGSLNGVDFASNVTPAGGGILALSVNQKLMRDAEVSVGDAADVEIARA